MKTVLIAAAGAYFGAAVLLAGCQGRILYQPHAGRSWGAVPSDIGLPWESAALETSDGLELDAWWIPAEDARGVLLFFHGNAGNISHRLTSIEQFHRLGLSILIIDYRGYGRSEGSPSEHGTALDARAGYDWIRRHSDFPPERIVVFGRSLGAAVAAELVRDVDAGGVILESAFRSVPELAASLYPWLPVRMLVRYGYHTEDYVTHFSHPLLVIHSRQDEIVPFSHGRAVFAAAESPKRFLEIRGGHNTGFRESEPRYSRAIDAFLREMVFPVSRDS